MGLHLTLTRAMNIFHHQPRQGIQRPAPFSKPHLHHPLALEKMVFDSFYLVLFTNIFSVIFLQRKIFLIPK